MKLKSLAYYTTGKNKNLTELHVAARDGDIQKVQSLLIAEPKIDINQSHRSNLFFLKTVFSNRTRYKNVTPLHLASMTGHINIVDLLLADERIEANKAATRFIVSTEDLTTHQYHLINATNFALALGHLNVARVLLSNDKVTASRYELCQLNVYLRRNQQTEVNIIDLTKEYLKKVIQAYIKERSDNPKQYYNQK